MRTCRVRPELHHQCDCFTMDLIVETMESCDTAHSTLHLLKTEKRIRHGKVDLSPPGYRLVVVARTRGDKIYIYIYIYIEPQSITFISAINIFSFCSDSCVLSHSGDFNTVGCHCLWSSVSSPLSLSYLVFCTTYFFTSIPLFTLTTLPSRPPL
ncbi:hypothetical protein EJ08DRAFT_321841 [Tothia fuscella]|uniref:Uncharacterized protein n=1 Tax=Tothia fuscella TaxID=1048955 RepID=A0A9P4NMP9_9PEZI|nr:hypothetical protein EJ08DRAFT_321841 [Tothia fuscella]